MNKLFRVVTVMVMAAAIGIVTTNAWAAWTVGAAQRDVLVQTTAATRNAVELNVNIAYTLEAGDALAAQDTIQITLTGGAIFAGVPTLTPAAGIDFGAGAGIAAPPLSGGAGTNSATWRVVSPGAGMAGTVVTLNSATAGLFNVSSMIFGSQCDALLNLRTLLGALIGSADRSYRANTLVYLFEGKNAFTAVQDDASDEAKVAAIAGPYTRFAADATAGSATTINVTNNSGVATVPAAVDAAAASILYTLTGDFTGIASVAAAGLTGSSAAGNITGGLPGFFMINAAKTAAYAVNTAALAGLGTLTPNPTFNLDGITPQAERTFTLSVQKLAEGPWLAYTFQPLVQQYAITRDGATRRILNVPSSSDAAGDRPFVRISNATMTAGKIYGTMWDQDGNLVGAANTVMLTSLPANATAVFNVSDLEALFGTWTGRARLQIDAELTDLGVMGLIRNPNGNLNNYSTGANSGDKW